MRLGDAKLVYLTTSYEAGYKDISEARRILEDVGLKVYQF